jgi:hypothetical protein
MKKIFLRIFPIYLIFTGIVTMFFFYGGGELNSPEYLSVLTPLTTLLFIMTLMMTLMGKPPSLKSVYGSYENCLIDFGVTVNRRRLRRWVSCSWGADESGIYIYTFGKVKEKADIKEIADIFVNDSAVTIVFKDRSWIISGSGYGEAVLNLREKAGLKNED